MSFYYSEFAKHCIRFYISYPKPHFETAAEGEDWIACRESINSLPDSDKELIINVYRNGDPSSDSVNQAARMRGMKPGAVWRMIKDFERMVAKQRGLI